MIEITATFKPINTNFSQTTAATPPKKPMKCIGFTKLEVKDGKMIETTHKYNDDGTETIIEGEKEL